MTDTVNKQALDRLSESTLSEMYERADRARGHEAHLSSDLFDAINALEAAYAYIDAITPPTTPVQGYREEIPSWEEIAGIQEARALQAEEELSQLRQALSQTDIQPSVVQAPQCHGEPMTIEEDWTGADFTKRVWFCNVCGADKEISPGINSTEDQPGPSISSTRPTGFKCSRCGAAIMVDGQGRRVRHNCTEEEETE